MQHRDRKITARRSVLVLLLMITAMGCSKSENPPVVATDIEFKPEGILDFFHADSTVVARIAIEIAESSAEQAQGLMYRRSMPDRAGMLFVSEGASMKSFWMKNTSLSLDILFVDSGGAIVNIVKRTTPFSEAVILSTEPAQYVVEVHAGFTDTYHITETDHISWERRTF